MNTRVYIAAGGESSRMRSKIEELGFPSGFPKGLLPTDESSTETFLGRTARLARALNPEREILIDTSREAAPHIKAHPDVDKGALINARKHDGTFFGSMLRNLYANGGRLLAYGSDIYTEDIEPEMTDHHNASPFPITFLAAPNTLRSRNGLAYNISKSGQITGFSRKEEGSEKDLINIGVYLFEPEKAVRREIENLIGQNKLLPGRSNNEALLEPLVDAGLVGAFVCDAAFNVNSPETYEAFLNRNELQKDHQAAPARGAVAVAATIALR